MERRAYLAALTATLSGCVAGYQATGSDATTNGTSNQDVDLVELGIPPTLCEEPIDPGGIHPVVEPAFESDWTGVDVPEQYGALTEETVVVGLTNDGSARAYPLAILWYHEAVNDTFGSPVLVTYCSICRSGMVAARRVVGERTQFAASGLLWQPPGEYTAARELDGDAFGATRSDPDADVRNSGNLVLYDEATESYWSQLLAEALCGPQKGERLTILPSRVATWGEWQADHPETDVLLPPPHSGTVPRL